MFKAVMLLVAVVVGLALTHSGMVVPNSVQPSEQGCRGVDTAGAQCVFGCGSQGPVAFGGLPTLYLLGWRACAEAISRSFSLIRQRRKLQENTDVRRGLGTRRRSEQLALRQNFGEQEKSRRDWLN